MLMLWLWLGAAAAGDCDLRAPPDAAFEVVPPASAARVHLLVEVWTDASSADWAREVLAVLEARDLQGALAVPLPNEDGPDDVLLQLAESASAAGHEVVVRLPVTSVPRDLQAPLGVLRDGLRHYQKAAGRIRTAVTVLPGRGSEALLGKAGFRTLLQADGSPSATPRLAAVFEGRRAVNVIFPPGPYDDACGRSPRATPFTPRAADRAATAIHAAIRSEGSPTVRLVLDGARGGPEDPLVLGRWLDEVVRPAGVRVSTPAKARQAARLAMRQGAQAPPPSEVGGRLVSIAEVEQAAAELAGVQILPRNLPGNLVLSEAMYAFLLVLADRTEGDVVRLGALGGPVNQARSVLGQEDVVELPRETVVAFATALLAELPDTMPTSMRVGGQLLTAPEILGLLASAVRGEDPATTRISASPDPNARGQGWGQATLP